METIRNGHLQPIRTLDRVNYRNSGKGDYDSNIPTNESEIPELVIHGDDFRIVLQGGCLAQVTRIGPKFYRYSHHHLGDGVAESIFLAFEKIGFKVIIDVLGFYQLVLPKQRAEQHANGIGLEQAGKDQEEGQDGPGSPEPHSGGGSAVELDRWDRPVRPTDCQPAKEGPTTQAKRILGPCGA